jgi:hypothetical protein
VLHLFTVYLFLSSPSSSPVDLATADDAPVIDYFVEDSFSSAKQPGKQNPLDHSDITHAFSLMLALAFATVIVCLYYDA